MNLFIRLIPILLLSLGSNAFANNLCSSIFSKTPKLLISKKIEAHLQNLLLKFPNNIRIVENVTTKVTHLNDGSISNRVLAISSEKLSKEDLNDIRNSLVEIKKDNFISFPTKSTADHLYIAFQDKTFDFDYRWGTVPNGHAPENWVTHFYKYNYEAFDGVRDINHQLRNYGQNVIEPFLLLSKSEIGHLSKYTEDIESSPLNVLGKFNYEGTYYEGPKKDRSNNIPLDANYGHNCTSWISMAPIRKNGYSLLSGTVVSSGHIAMVATHPKWFLGNLLSQGAEKVPLVIFWTHNSIAETHKMLNETGIQIDLADY